MDRRMPVMDGMEATKRIRELPNGTEVKIVAVTASAFEEQRGEMLAAGMDDYVRKPYRADELYRTLSKELGVKYLYKVFTDTPDRELSLTPEMMESLPDELHCELTKALEQLDAKYIETIIQQIATYDKSLHNRLVHLVSDFNYPVILRCLRRPNEGACDHN
jgi:CheY-like chemotaxis protein